MAKKRKKTVAQQQSLSIEKSIIKFARKLPIVACYLNANWETAGLANIIVVREHKSGNVTFGSYLVDTACKGVKESYYRFNESPSVVNRFVDMETGDFIECEYKLAHNIIFESLAYAEDYGFYPDKDFVVSKYILEEDDGTIEDMEIHLGGEDGLPFLVVHDPVTFARDMKILERTAGEGNFNYMANIGSESLEDVEGFNDDYNEDEHDK